MSMSMTAGRAGNPERIFYQGMIVVVIATVVFGFSRSFFLRPLFPGVHAPQEIFFYLHGTVFTLWLALLFTQASLVGAGNVAMHRRLGVAGFVMVPLMVVLGLIGGSIAAHRPGGFIDIPVPPLEFLIVPYAAFSSLRFSAGRRFCSERTRRRTSGSCCSERSRSRKPASRAGRLRSTRITRSLRCGRRQLSRCRSWPGTCTRESAFIRRP